MLDDDLIERDRVNSIVGAFYDVYDYFGYGLPEAAYSGALEYELRDRGHRVDRELAIEIEYKGRHVCWLRLDLVVDNAVIVENKSSEKLPPYAQRRLLNYLRASSIQVGLVLHFGPEPKFHRLVDTVKRNRGTRTP